MNTRTVYFCEGVLDDQYVTVDASLAYFEAPVMQPITFCTNEPADITKGMLEARFSYDLYKVLPHYNIAILVREYR